MITRAYNFPHRVFNHQIMASNENIVILAINITVEPLHGWNVCQVLAAEQKQGQSGLAATALRRKVIEKCKFAWLLKLLNFTHTLGRVGMIGKDTIINHARDRISFHYHPHFAFSLQHLKQSVPRNYCFLGKRNSAPALTWEDKPSLPKQSTGCHSSLNIWKIYLTIWLDSSRHPQESRCYSF